MTPLQREALQMCLEYIETDAHERRHVRWKINEALAEPQQEPVVWIPIITWRWNNNAETWEGLTNTSPPAQEFVCSTSLCHYRKPLTPDLEADTGYSRDERAAFTAGWEAAEAAHGIKGDA